MRKIRKIFWGLVVCSILLVFYGCGENPSGNTKKIGDTKKDFSATVSIWEGDSMILEFFKDGTFYFDKSLHRKAYKEAAGGNKPVLKRIKEQREMFLSIDSDIVTGNYWRETQDKIILTASNGTVLKLEIGRVWPCLFEKRDVGPIYLSPWQKESWEEEWNRFIQKKRQMGIK